MTKQSRAATMIIFIFASAYLIISLSELLAYLLKITSRDAIIIFYVGIIYGIIHTKIETLLKERTR